MRILLIGYGKMGKAIEAIALSRGHQIIGRHDPQSNHTYDFTLGADVAIEFTTPAAAVSNIRQCITHHIPVVCGTTGWLEEKPTVDAFCKEHKGTLFYASNYSIGVQIFFRLNIWLSERMSHQPGYEPIIEEIHHTAKKDAPSGTAITLAEGILKHLHTKTKWVNQPSHLKEELVIQSLRQDPFPGTHTIQWNSPVDSLEIRHTAHSREGFASGAVQVAEWIQGRTGVLGMDDFLPF